MFSTRPRCVCIVLIGVALGSPGVALGGWAVTRVDAGGDVGECPSIALGPASSPAISYYDRTNGDLKYAALSGSTWAIQTVDSAGSVGKYTSLAFDSVGQPRISYFDETNGNVKYAAFNGASWEFTVVGAGSASSLALDTSGNPHIAYRAADGNLAYKVWNGSAFVGGVVPSGGYAGAYDPSLKLDPAGNARIAHSGSSGVLYSQSNGSWTTELLEADVGYVRAGARLALDTATAAPRIAYSLHGGLRYAAWDGSQWVGTGMAVDPDAHAGFPSIALDSTGNPRIAYGDYIDQSLKYAAWNGATWAIETLDSGIGSTDPSLVLDSSGNWMIAYYDGVNGDLKYAPEPATLSLLALGGLAEIWRRRK